MAGRFRKPASLVPGAGSAGAEIARSSAPAGSGAPDERPAQARSAAEAGLHGDTITIVLARSHQAACRGGAALQQ
ncbi:MAG: hypothetical protein ACXWIY_12845, partial [Caldimonas sp.]